MDLALTGLLLLALLLPALLLRVGFRGRRGFEHPAKAIEPSLLTFGAELVWILPLSVFIHYVGVVIASALGNPVDLGLAVDILAGASSNSDLSGSIGSKVSKDADRIVFYFLATCAVCLVLGYFAQVLVISLSLHRRFGLLEYRSPWTYFIRGEGPFNRSVHSDPDAVYITLSILLGDSIKTYRGIVDWFSLDRNGELKSIRLLILSDDDGAIDHGERGVIFRYSDALFLGTDTVYIREVDTERSEDDA